MGQHAKIFISYAHEDQTLLKQLERHLALLRQQGHISLWDSRNISAGSKWADEIDIYLNEADIILLLISAAFLASEYCYSVEMKRALKRQKQGSVRVIPIILRHVDWKEAPFSHLQALPTGAIPAIDQAWHDQDEAFADIAQGIRQVVQELHARDNRVRSSDHKKEEQQIKPGGVWLKPKNGEKVRDILHFAAYAYPTCPGDPAIDHVNFTIGWNGYWQVACTAQQPANGNLYSGDIDLRKLDLPPDELRISFDVYDQQNNANLAPQGKRTIQWIATQKQPSSVLSQWLRRIRNK